MKRTHLIAGACVAALGGVVTGATINTTPLARGVDAWDHIPRHEFTDAALDAAGRTPSTPDHYPLITPNGRIEVAELRDHGLYRNRRFGLADGWYEPAEEPSYEVVEADYRYIPDDLSPTAHSAAPADADLVQEAPVELAANARPLNTADRVSLPVRPRTIDVAATLASRQ